MESKSYREPLTNMDIDTNNLEKWKNKLKYVSIIPNTILSNIDIQTRETNIEKKKALYFDRVKNFIDNNSAHLLKNLVSVNKSRRILEDRRTEYNNIMRRYNRSIKQYKDKYGKNIEIKMVLNTNKDKFMAQLQYYNYKKTTKDTYDKDIIINSVNDFILKHQMYGLYMDNLMVGFLIIKKSRKFIIDDDTDKKDTFYIQEVYIDKNMRRRMLGKILLDYAILLCPINKNYISLMTYEGNGIVNIALSTNFILQRVETDCPINRLLFIRKMNETDFLHNQYRISASI